MPKQKQKSGPQKREERKKREARSTSGAQNISDMFSKKGESVKLVAHGTLWFTRNSIARLVQRYDVGVNNVMS